MSGKLFGKDLKAYEDIDVDALLETLSPEELEELGQELIDPDDSCIPPSERCRYKTDKEPTGPYDRKKLIEFLEKQAKEEKDWEEAKPYSKEIRGKVWKPKEEEKIQINEDEAVDTEWDEVLANATEEELVDLAAILGFHGMLNQVQYHKAFVSGDGDDEGDDDDDDEEEGKETKKRSGGFQGVAKHENFKVIADDPPNDTDVDASLQQIKDNDAKLKELNLNNIKNISLQRLCEFGSALKTNTNLEHLQMANVRATDKVAKIIGEALKDNKTLKILNLESNYISGEGIIALLEGINANKIVSEFRITNQRPQILGNRIEMRIAKLVKFNYQLLKFGIHLQVPDARVRVQEYIKRNNDRLRKQRMGVPLEPELKPEEEPEYKARVHTTESASPAAKKEEPAKEEEESDEESSEEESDEE